MISKQAPSQMSLGILYRPVINTRDGQVLIYRAIPTLKTDGGDIIGAKKVLQHLGNPIETAGRHKVFLQKVSADLEKAHNNGRVVFVMVPINAQALETKESATAMVETLKSLSPVCSHGFISHLFNLPDPLKLSTLDDVVIPLLVTIEKFVIEPPNDLDDYTDIAACNAQGVVLDMQQGDVSTADLTNLWARGAPRRLGLFVQNIDDQELIPVTERYECLGIDGPVVSGVSQEIGPRTTWDQVKAGLIS